MIRIIEIHTAELKRRTRGGGRCHSRRKKKISDQLLNSKSFSLKSFNSICKSIIENINTTIQELKKIVFLQVSYYLMHFQTGSMIYHYDQTSLQLFSQQLRSYLSLLILWGYFLITLIHAFALISFQMFKEILIYVCLDVLIQDYSYSDLAFVQYYPSFD